MNAAAGPSNLYLIPPRPSQPPARLASTHDLVTRFHLLPAYDKYVRDDQPDDNGKGKAREQPPSPGPQTPGDHDGDDDDPTQLKGEKKRKNSYKHLIKGVPGKHSMKKDDFLAGIMQVPPKQHINIAQFDLKTQREAFSVSLEGLKGWNPNTLIQESAQAREDRKRRKELKRLAKAHAQAAAQAAATGSPLPVATTPRPSVGTPRPSVGTPRPSVGTPRPVPRPSVPPVTVPSYPSTTPIRTGTPTSATPHPFGVNPFTAPDRGVKREREPDILPNGNGVAQQAPVITASKAGIAGARPRPLKKLKTDHIPAVHQQPTPQGV
ncbi:hypothetical protein C8F01DRAFT_1119896 [Mycena amicta]|nr:hypothetical protein C8F01DRAFT_1119896 [Mycena amicta]